MPIQVIFPRGINKGIHSSIRFRSFLRLKQLCLAPILAAFSFAVLAQSPSLALKIEQLTYGDKHHFFGYIGQCLTIPWNESGQYILGLEIDSIHRMPHPAEAAAIILIDTNDNNWILHLDQTHAWNPQQGNRRSGAFARSEGISKGAYSGDIRIDPAPRLNRTNDAILVPGISNNNTRQMFVIRVIYN